jgi:hypothetical protein
MTVKKFLRIAVPFVAMIAFTASAQADVVTTDFTTAQSGNYGKVTSFASLTLTLNPDGTIAAVLTPVDLDAHYFGIGLNSAPGANLRITDLPSIGYQTGYVGSLGNFNTGFDCFPLCTGITTFTISDVKPFISVRSVFTGGTSYYDAFLWTRKVTVEQYAGMFSYVNTNAVPEPASLVLIGIGLTGIFAIRHRNG